MNTASETESPFTPYLPRLLIQWQSETPEAAFRELDGTVLFVDISGFTRMSERLAQKGKVGAEEVTDGINSTFSELLEIAWQDGGGLIKFGGDALLLFFPGALHAARACRAAVGMRAALRRIGRIKTSAGLVSLRMSAGIHSGAFHFFLAGSSHRELIIAGPAASRTVEMESAAEAGDIVVSPATAALLDPRVVGPEKGPGFQLVKPPIVPAGPPDVTAVECAGDLSAFLPAVIRKHIGAASGEGEHRQATIAFIAFCGTDFMLLSGNPADVAERLDRLVRTIQTAASEHDICFLGTDIDRDGGKVILTAGAPQSSGSDEEQMLRALRAIVDGDPALELRIGVSRGHVFAGEVGAPFRRTYTVMGDAVNLAARLMQRAPPGRLLATGDVLERSRTLFEATPLEPLVVKGKTRPIVAFVVGAARGARRTDARGQLPLIGREREMGALLSAFSSARQGVGRVVVLVGEAGMGKTRLLAELKRHVDGAIWVAAACEQYESSTPYSPFRGLLRSLVGLRPDEHGRQAGRRLRLSVQAVAPHLAPWLPLLAAVMDVTVAATRESQQLKPAFRKAQLQRTVEEFLARLLAEPAVIVFEDAHWMDDVSSDLVRHLLDGISRRPWLVCIARRPQDTGFSATAGEDRVMLPLQPLSAPAAAELISAAAEDMPLPQHRLDSIADRAGGNPLFLRELVAAGGVQGGTEELPGSVEAVITARIDRLAPRARKLLRYASVVGPSFSLDLLATSAPDAAVDLQDTALWNDLREFVESDAPGSFRFRHALFRDVAYEGLPYRRRRYLHDRVGDVLEQQAAERADELAELLSLHAYRAQKYDKAWRYSLIAGDRARAKFANVEAADFYRRALEVARSLHDVQPAELAGISEALGDVSELAGLYTDAAEAYRKSRRMPGAGGIVETRLMMKSGVIAERSGRYTQALRWYSRALRRIDALALGAAASENRIQLGLAYVGVLFRQGRYSEGIRWCHEVLREAERTNDRAEMAHAYYLLVFGYGSLGNPESRRYRALALPIYEELGDLVGQANVLNNLGVEAYYEGNWSEALAFYERSKALRQRAGDVVGEAAASNNIGEILSDQGRLAEAEALFRDALRIWRAARYPAGVAAATSNLGRAALRAGRSAEAKRLLEDALSRFRVIGAESFVLETEARIAEGLILDGQYSAAHDLAASTLERAAEARMTVLQAMLQRVRGDALVLAGDHDRAIRCLEDSLRLGRSADAKYEIALTLEALARLATLAGRSSAASAYLAESASILERLGVCTAAQGAAPIADASRDAGASFANVPPERERTDGLSATPL